MEIYINHDERGCGESNIKIDAQILKQRALFWEMVKVFLFCFVFLHTYKVNWDVTIDLWTIPLACTDISINDCALWIAIYDDTRYNTILPTGLHKTHWVYVHKNCILTICQKKDSNLIISTSILTLYHKPLVKSASDQFGFIANLETLCSEL